MFCPPLLQEFAKSESCLVWPSIENFDNNENYILGQACWRAVGDFGLRSQYVNHPRVRMWIWLYLGNFTFLGDLIQTQILFENNSIGMPHVPLPRLDEGILLMEEDMSWFQENAPLIWQ